MIVYSLTDENMNNLADSLKVVLIKALVREKIITEEIAEKWCETHTLLKKKKSFFRTISGKWLNASEREDEYYFIVVKLA